MWKNYLKVSLRHLTRHRLYSLINMAGLTVALATCLLIGLFVEHEYSYDDFHPKAEQLHKAWVKEVYAGEEFFYTTAAYPVGEWIKDRMPAAEAVCRLNEQTMRVSNTSEQLKQDELVQFVDENFFEVFGFDLLQGQPDQVLASLDQVVISESVAERYLGSSKEAVGQTLRIKLDSVFHSFRVSGVVADHPGNSTVPCNILLPLEALRSFYNPRIYQTWTMTFAEVYVRLSANSNAADVDALLVDLGKDAMGDDYEPGGYTVGLHPLQEIYLNTEIPEGFIATSDQVYSYLLGGIALLVLAVAIFNYITIAIGASVKRALEVGVRKVNGAMRGDITRQFLVESVLLCFAALALSVLLAELLLPAFNSLAEKELAFPYTLPVLALLLGTGLLIGLVAGSYPALILARLAPSRVIKGHKEFKPGRENLRKVMVSLQFAASIALISVTILMQQQVNYLQNRSLGFDQDHIIYVPWSDTFAFGSFTDLQNRCAENTQLLRAELEGKAGILDVAQATHALGMTQTWTNLHYRNEAGNLEGLYVNGVDEHYLPMLGYELLEGRNFDDGNASDKQSAVIANESFMKHFGLQTGDYLPGPYKEYKVIGTVKDFHFASLREKVAPALLTMNMLDLLRASDDINTSSFVPKVHIKLEAGKYQESIAAMASVWKDLFPEQPFEYHFLDDNLDRMYAADQRLGTLVSIAGGLSVFIGLLGLVGLVSLSLSRRRKEMGIRKILGAKVSQIILIIAREFALVVGMGALIAIPLSWWGMHQWLQDFAYRIEIGPLVFVAALLVVALLSLATIWLRSLQAARSNPVHALRNE